MFNNHFRIQDTILISEMIKSSSHKISVSDPHQNEADPKHCIESFNLGKIYRENDNFVQNERLKKNRNDKVISLKLSGIVYLKYYCIKKINNNSRNSFLVAKSPRTTYALLARAQRECKAT